MLEDCEISDSDAIKDKGKASLECMKGKRYPKASFQKHFLPRLKLAYTRHGGEAICCRGVSRPAAQRLTGKKEGQVNPDSYNGQGAWRPWSFFLTEEEDDEDLLTNEDAMSQDEEEQQLWPDMCSPCRPFFKYHGPGPDPWSPGAMGDLPRGCC